jgi:L-lactate dehydrogenase complex protein LldF
LALWAWLAQRPVLYRLVAESASRVLGWAGARRGRFRALPLAAGWTAARDMPAPEGRSFHSLWAERRRRSLR